MIIAHLDCSTGVSGDKFLGALMDVGIQTGKFTEADLSVLTAALAPEAKVEVGDTSSHGITAKSITLSVHCRLEDVHHARSWADIRANIEALPDDILAPAARGKAIFVFSELAKVEAKIHGSAVDEVHFHEIGAADSIVDIVAACAAMDALCIEKLFATPPALGSGTVDTAHGSLPVPAPATAALMIGIPSSMSSAAGELTTPTGAALLKLAEGFGPVPPMIPRYLGYGAGTRDIGQPNICRLLVGELDEEAQGILGLATKPQQDETILLEANIDHIAPEAVAFAGEQLLAEGALDVWVTPIAMKKGRAALTLSVLTKPDEADNFAQRMMKLTGTLGVRASLQPRYVTDRAIVAVRTRWGQVKVKVGSGRVRPEHEDIARIAREQKLDYPQVLQEITTEAQNQLMA